MRGNRFEFCKRGLSIVTEDANGDAYTIIVRHVQDMIRDWKGECNFVPTNDARVFYAVHNGTILRLPEGCDFETFIQRLMDGSILKGERKRAV